MDRESQENYLKKLARVNVCEGIRYEPRLYWDQFNFPVGTRVVPSSTFAFRNGEQWPVRIRYITAIMGRNAQSSPPEVPAPGDERLIQRYGFRIQAHDTAYMADSHIPFPLWHNRRISGPDSANRGMAVWQFDHAVALGDRDAFVADASILSAAANGRGFNLAFTGIGRASRRPYFFATRTNFTTTVMQQLEVDDLRNEGAEVVDVTQMSVFIESQRDSSNPSGDIQEGSLQLLQQGNGSQRPWAHASPDLATDRAPAALWGPTLGRAIVHELPGDGWVWLPGQGVNASVLSLDTTRASIEDVFVGMLGEMIIT